jgi:hypothetical protein
MIESASHGSLTEMLNSLADFYDEKSKPSVRFVTLIEPAMLVFMGVGHRRHRAGAVPAALPTHLGHG